MRRSLWSAILALCPLAATAPALAQWAAPAPAPAPLIGIGLPIAGVLVAAVLLVRHFNRGD
jgi:hypothetical protein